MHPIHISVCNLELNDTENVISLKLFKDDFALVLKNNYQVDIPMEKADDTINSQVISRYVNSCLQIGVSNGNNLGLNYTHSEINDDAIWIYFQVEKLNKISRLRIKNTLMMDLWDDQTNLMIIAQNGVEKGYRFNRNQVEIDIDLN
jgi:hypothetical protein